MEFYECGQCRAMVADKDLKLNDEGAECCPQCYCTDLNEPSWNYEQVQQLLILVDDQVAREVVVASLRGLINKQEAVVLNEC